MRAFARIGSHHRGLVGVTLTSKEKVNVMKKNEYFGIFLYFELFFLFAIMRKIYIALHRMRKKDL